MYLDTANLKEIDQALKSGVFVGLTTNPAILHRESVNRNPRIQEILQRDLEIVYVQVVGDTVEDRLEDAEIILALNPNKIGIKIPLDQIGLETVKRFKQLHPRVPVLGTAIYTATQAILGVLAGCDTLAPYVNRMLVSNIDPYAEIAAMRQFIDERDSHCRIIAASFKQPQQVTLALNAGAHTCTLPFDIYEKMIDVPQAIDAIKVFNEKGREVF